MLDTIKQFFESKISVQQVNDEEQQLKLATAALFIEMIQQDGQVLDEEKIAAKKAIKTCFTISDSETEALFQLAEQELGDSIDYYQFTQLITQYYSQVQKIKIVENLWTIAYSDNHLDELEEHMVRRIADLIHVPHRHFIQTKLRVEKQLGITQ